MKIQRNIESIYAAIEYIKLTCEHTNATYVSKYFSDSEVWYCGDCDSRFTKEAEEL